MSKIGLNHWVPSIPQSSVSSEPEFQGIHLLPLADASREFLESIGCHDVPSLTDLGRTQVDVPADGSCGPHAVLAGLYELGLTPIKVRGRRRTTA